MFRPTSGQARLPRSQVQLARDCAHETGFAVRRAKQLAAILKRKRKGHLRMRTQAS